MDFDHREGEVKLFNISMRMKVDASVLSEIAKCDIVCACCHRVRTRLREFIRIQRENDLLTQLRAATEEIHGKLPVGRADPD